MLADLINQYAATEANENADAVLNKIAKGQLRIA